ncbi:M20 metallopeptidase family protein [Galactobacter caseinivorans]|uniref:M20 metallopeptidase family protein n=1 Tax=Galactobacter caseinivorans TaxID=2676123 RepID=UPI001F489D90|nr:M20 family metallopeptidase [Galactobacter caseinivorans]
MQHSAPSSASVPSEPRLLDAQLRQRLERSVEEHTEQLLQLRHELHAHPETGLELEWTAARVRREFEALGLEITDARDVGGFVAVLRGGAAQAAPPERERGLVLLRADMDALPLTEETGLDYASTNGAMHACGHDLHMAGLVGAARALHSVRESLIGDVLFFLQPGEEGHDGARYMIEGGLLEAAGRLPDHAYGIHVWSGLYPAGTVASRPGPLMASSDVLEVTVHGKGGHGSAPFLAADPVPVIADMITQSHVLITRTTNTFDPVVVTCGSVQAGTTSNIIPERALAKFTVRAFSDAGREAILARLKQLFEHLAAAHGMRCEVEHPQAYPTTVNDAAETDFARQVTEEIYPGAWAPMEHPVGAAEDFSRVLQAIPGAYLFVSAVPEGTDAASAPMNHSALAHFSDDAVPRAALLLASLAATRLGGTDPTPAS